MILAMFGMLISYGNDKGGKVEIEKEYFYDTMCWST